MSDVTTELANEAIDKAMEIARLKAENTELRESVKRLMTQRDERLARAEADNDKLRELVRLMWKPFCWAQSGYETCLTDDQDAEIRDKVRKLGVGVDA